MRRFAESPQLLESHERLLLRGGGWTDCSLMLLAGHVRPSIYIWRPASINYACRRCGKQNSIQQLPAFATHANCLHIRVVSKVMVVVLNRMGRATGVGRTTLSSGLPCRGSSSVALLLTFLNFVSGSRARLKKQDQLGIYAPVRMIWSASPVTGEGKPTPHRKKKK